VNRPLSFTDYGNLGRVTGTSVHDGDGIWVIDADADRVYRMQELFVDQTTGVVGTPKLTTNMFYDRRGNVEVVYAPTAPVTQRRCDGAKRRNHGNESLQRLN